jgi:hypothetical protein
MIKVCAMCVVINQNTHMFSRGVRLTYLNSTLLEHIIEILLNIFQSEHTSNSFNWRFSLTYFSNQITHIAVFGRGRDRMVVGFTNSCAINAYHH